MVYGSGTGSICYDQGLDEHSLLTQKSLKNQGKRPFRPKFSSPAARLKRKVGSLRSPNGTPPSASTPVTSQVAVAYPGLEGGPCRSRRRWWWTASREPHGRQGHALSAAPPSGNARMGSASRTGVGRGWGGTGPRLAK